MQIGDKIRNLRSLKGLSQENMAAMLDMSVVAYGDIERNKKDINLKRLEQIAEVFGISVADILAFGDRVSNFFEQCNQTNVVTGQNGNQHYYNDAKELQHQLEKAQMEIEKLKIEVLYWKEKFEHKF